nr:glycerophosphodiester phosphodiesterase GDPD1, chloroplastic-like [Tanacetum cinerariifolium]
MSFGLYCLQFGSVGCSGVVHLYNICQSLRNPSAAREIKESNLSLLTYGKLNNFPETVHVQHLMGIDGVIVDLVEEITRAVDEFKPRNGRGDVKSGEIGDSGRGIELSCVLSQKAFDAFCENFHIPEEVHHVLPDRGNTMHERPAGKIGLYNRFSILPTLDCLCPYFLLIYSAADFNVQDYATLVAHPSPFWKFPEEFLCLVGLSCHYTLDEKTYPYFWIMTERVNTDIFAFIHTSDPIKVKVIERERKGDEPRLLETTVGRTVPLLPVAPDRGESELDASGMNIQPVTETTDVVAEDVIPLQPRRLKKRKTIVADAGGPSHPPKKLREDHETSSGVFVGSKSMSAVQRLFARAVQNVEVRGEPIPTIPFVTSSVSAIPEREGEDFSHHSGANIADAEVDSFTRPSVLVLTTTTTITSTVDPVVVVKEKIIKPSLFAAESTSAGVTDPTMAGLTDLTGSDFLYVTNGSRLDDGSVCREMVDEFAPLKFFASVRGMEHDQLFTEFNVGAAHQMSLSAEVRMRAEYNIREKKRLKSVIEEKDRLLKARDKEVKNLKAQLLLKEVEATEAIRLRAETSKLETAEKSLRYEVNALNERKTILEKEHNALDVKVTNLEAIVISKERELTDSTTQLTSIKSQNDNLADQVHELQVSFSELIGKLSNYENLTERLEEFQDAQLKVINNKFDKLYTDFVEMSFHLEERFYPHLLTTIAGHRWLLTYGMELVVAKCLNSPDYLYAFGTSISKAIEKGMKDGLVAEITHGKEGRVLTDVAAHNPFTKADYVSALQQLQGVNFPLLMELKANKDASIKVVMNILRLEEHLAERLSLNESQPHDDHLMVPINHSPDKTVVGASALSLALDVFDAWVQRIRENIMSHRSLFQDVFIPLAEPFSAAAVTCTEGTFDTVPATVDTIVALFVTFASASIVDPIFIDDYEVTSTDDQPTATENVADENASPFPNVDDAKLNIP